MELLENSGQSPVIFNYEKAVKENCPKKSTML